MKKNVMLLLVTGLCCLLTTFAKADLLGVSPSYPQIDFVNNDAAAISFDPVTKVFSVNALPYSLFLSGQDQGTLIVTNNSVQILLDTDGNMLSGTNGFVLSGQFTEVVNGVTNNYSGVMLQGDVVAFGYAYWGLNNPFDLRVHVNGGALKSLFDCADDLAVSLTSENSTFTGSFATAFNGSAKGNCGPEDLTPPVVTCPPLDQVVTTPAADADGNPGYIVTYPDPLVTDNCDPVPASFCDTPSGSFLYLNPGDNLTVTCYGIDVSGNVGTCSFTVMMGVNVGPGASECSLAFTNSGCPAITLPTDPAQCLATYTFAPLIATNCSTQFFVASATALNEKGSAISLTILTNGLLQGQFPRTLTTIGNIITFTATDGQGNSAVQQCQVFVQDQQPPTLVCQDQTATFKPVMTNALSCIAADFNDPCIAAGNYLWFSSVIHASSCQNRGGVFTVHITDQTIQLAVDNTNITLSVPDAYVYFSNGVATATSVFTNNQWVTYSSLNCSGNTFAAGLAWKVPFNLNNLTGKCWGRDYDDCKSQFRRRVNSATWSARFGINTNGVTINWQWGAVVESQLNTNPAVLCVKPTDDPIHSCWKNLDPAGACENYKPYLLCGARGNGIYCQGGHQVAHCTGILSRAQPCNLGKGIICDGVVNYTPPVAFDNCGNPVSVTCNPPSGSLFGPGKQWITCTAVDASGNTSQSTFALTVLAPVQVVIDYPACDNVADNTAQPDAGFSDMNCPDDPSTVEQVTCFKVGSCILHQVRLLDCNGNDVTASLAPFVSVHIDVTERLGTYANSYLVNDLPQKFACIGSPGSLMIPYCGAFYYNLNTAGYPTKTVHTSTFFRSCVWVDYNSSPGTPVGMEDVLLQSQ